MISLRSRGRRSNGTRRTRPAASAPTDGAAASGARTMTSTCMNDDPFDMKADQVSRALIVWAAGVMGWNLLSRGDIRDCHPVCDAVLVGERAAYRFKDHPLQLVRTNARDRTRLLLPALKHRLAHVVAVAATLAGGVARRHPVAPIIKDEAHEQRSAFRAAPPVLGGLGRELRLNGLPEAPPRPSGSRRRA